MRHQVIKGSDDGFLLIGCKAVIQKIGFVFIIISEHFMIYISFISSSLTKYIPKENRAQALHKIYN